MALLRQLVAGAAAALLCMAAQAQPYPSRPIHIIVPTGAGGLADVMARLVGEKLQQRMGQPIVVENKPGAGGLLGGEFVAKSRPDGYTVLVSTSAFPLLAHTNRGSMRFDVLKDLMPITKALDLQNLVIASTSAPFKDIKGMIDYAKANPGKLSFGATGIGTTTHLGGELLKQRAGIDMVMVPFKGTQQTYAAVMAGDIQLAVDSVSGSLPHIQSGRFVPIAILSEHRSPVLPQVPTAAEAGLPGVTAPSWIGFMTPGGTPPEVNARLQRELSAILKSPEITEQFRKLGAETVGDASDQFGRTIASEYSTWERVIRNAGLKFD